MTMKMLTTTKNMMVKIEEQVHRCFSVTLKTVDGSSIACSGFPTIQAAMNFAIRFDREYKQREKV